LKGIKIAPSILAADLSDLKSAMKDATDGGADLIHLDVIDGHFAPNITFGPGTVKALRPVCDLPFDTHLMISDPLFYIDKFINAGSDIMTVHSEALTARKFDLLEARIHQNGRRIGLALKPATSMPGWALERLGKIDVLLVMTVNPGFSGQLLEQSVFPKLAKLSVSARGKNPKIDVEVDGGVEASNVHEVVKRGANVLVAGAAVFGKKDVSQSISELRSAALG
jgi:ribulose-phosphate 3-epimerase